VIHARRTRLALRQSLFPNSKSQTSVGPRVDSMESRGVTDKFYVLGGTPFFITPHRYTNQFDGCGVLGDTYVVVHVRGPANLVIQPLVRQELNQICLGRFRIQLHFSGVWQHFSREGMGTSRRG
jgi:hypothetical protein